MIAAIIFVPSSRHLTAKPFMDQGEERVRVRLAGNPLAA
jgi:hypothetical protein